MTNKNKDIYKNLNYLSKQDKLSTTDRIKVLGAMNRLEKGWTPTKTQQEVYNKNSELVDKSIRKDLQKQLAYAKQKYNKHYKKELSKVNDLYKAGNLRTKGAIDRKLGAGDNWRNKYFRLSNEEIQDLINEFNKKSQEINSVTKRKAKIIEESYKILVDSLKLGNITKEEFRREVATLEKRGVQFGFSKMEVGEIMDKIDFDSWDY